MIRYLWSACLSLAFVATAPLITEAQQLVAESQVPGMKIEIRDLKRDEGGTLTLRFQLTNERNTEVPLSQLAGRGNDWGSDYTYVSGMYLLDIANRKKQLVVRDSEGKCICSLLSYARLSAGGKVNLWAKFPAPPENVRKVSVMLANFEPVDVPIAPR
jgi:hypothetical protein